MVLVSGEEKMREILLYLIIINGILVVACFTYSVLNMTTRGGKGVAWWMVFTGLTAATAAMQLIN